MRSARQIGARLRRSLSTVQEVPKHAEVVVVGGGIIGSSVAYHLAKRNCSSVVLLESSRLTAGTTWHAAGLMVTFGSLSTTSTALRKYTKELYRDILPEETGLSTGFRPCGFVELASKPNRDFNRLFSRETDRLEEFRRIAAFNRYCGVDVEEIGPREVQELFPLCRVDDVLAGFYVPTDGRVNPVDATTALAKAARMRGVDIREGVRVKEILSRPLGAGRRRVTGVLTDDGQTIHAEKVINCAGMWARDLAKRSGVVVPNQACEHYYLITDSMEEVGPDWPVVEDPENFAYIRPEGDGLMVGLFEGDPAPWGPIPEDFSFGEIQPDWDRVSPFLEAAMSRVPKTLEVGAKKLFCGPESFTPDGQPILGEAPEVDNLFVAAGLNSIGILTGGGVGDLMAGWVMDGEAPPEYDVTCLNIDRFQSFHATSKYIVPRSAETLGNVYKTHYPDKQPETSRGVKCGPLHGELARQGAVFKDVSGWEGVDHFQASKADAEAYVRDRKYSFHRPKCWQQWKDEHELVRHKAALIDMSFMSKFKVVGKEAGRLLNFVSTSDVLEDETITYTQFLNRDGRMEADVTVTKLNPEEFLVVATDTMHRHVETHLRKQIYETGFDANVIDVSGALCQLNVQGPQSREILQQATPEDISNDAFPFRRARHLEIGSANVLCTRITYVGELGFEMFIPVESANHIYRIIREAAPDGVGHAGLRALGSLRMEKAYRDYGHDMDNTDTLLEVGLAFTANFEKQGGFLGRDAVLEMKAQKKASRRLLQVLVLEPEIMLHHGDLLLRDGEVVGDIRCATYGHSLGGGVGLSMVEREDGGKPKTSHRRG